MNSDNEENEANSVASNHRRSKKTDTTRMFSLYMFSIIGFRFIRAIDG
jgi:hypothetical protein